MSMLKRWTVKEVEDLINESFNPVVLMKRELNQHSRLHLNGLKPKYWNHTQLIQFLMDIGTRDTLKNSTIIGKKNLLKCIMHEKGNFALRNKKYSW